MWWHDTRPGLLLELSPGPTASVRMIMYCDCNWLQLFISDLDGLLLAYASGWVTSSACVCQQVGDSVCCSDTHFCCQGLNVQPSSSSLATKLTQWSIIKKQQESHFWVWNEREKVGFRDVKGKTVTLSEYQLSNNLNTNTHMYTHTHLIGRVNGISGRCWMFLRCEHLKQAFGEAAGKIYCWISLLFQHAVAENRPLFPSS